MGRPKKKPDDNVALETPALRLRVFVRSDMIGTGKMEMLRLLGECGSISGVAREMDIGYRRVWSLLDSMQRCFKEPLFETSRGGETNGGAKLTEFGTELVAKYSDFKKTMETNADPFLAWIKENQSTPP